MTPQTIRPPAVGTGEYIPKDMAAAILGLSTRRTLELAAEHNLQTVRERNPETNMIQTLLLRSDVERLAQDRRIPIARSFPAASAAPEPPQLAAPPPLQIAAPAAPETETHASLRFEDLPRCAWLTLEESAVYTGLQVASLSALIRTGTLPTLGFGTRAGGRLRIKRSDLDGITGVRVQAEAE